MIFELGNVQDGCSFKLELGNLGFGFSARHAAAVLGGVPRSFAIAGQVLPVVPRAVLQGLLVHQPLTVLILHTVHPCLSEISGFA